MFKTNKTMTQDEKLQSLIEWLDKHGIKYVQPTDGEIDNFVRLFIKKMKIVVFTCPNDKEDFCYQAASLARQRAFFVRENEDMDFIIEKIQNCLKGRTVAKAQREKSAVETQKRVEQRKTKRQRIHVIRKPIYEKVSR